MMRDALNQLGTPGESRDERLTLKYRRCFRKQVSSCVGLSSMAAGGGSREKSSKLCSSSGPSASLATAPAAGLALVSVPRLLGSTS